MRALSTALLALALGACGHQDPSASKPQGYWYDWSGNTIQQFTDHSKVTTSYAVLDQSRAQYGDTWGTGYAGFDAAFVPGRTFDGYSSPGLDTSAQYLYMYEDVADTDSQQPVAKMTLDLRIDWSQITSWGYVQGLGLANDAGPVSAKNPFGSDAVGTAGSRVGVDLPHVVSIADGPDAGIAPNDVVLTPRTFSRAWPSHSMVPGRRSVIVLYTSNYPPGTTSNHVQPDVPNVPVDPNH